MSQHYPVPIPLPQPKSRPLPDSRGNPDTLALQINLGQSIGGSAMHSIEIMPLAYKISIFIVITSLGTYMKIERLKYCKF